MDQHTETSIKRGLGAFVVIFLIAWQLTGQVLNWYLLAAIPIAVLVGVDRPDTEPGEAYYD